jgi:hypothetical protein
MGTKSPIRSSTRSPSSAALTAWRRVFEIDGGYVVLTGARSGAGSAAMCRPPHRSRHLTVVARAPGAGRPLAGRVRPIAELDPARVLIYAAEDSVAAAEAAALFARALRGACRAECCVILDSLRALRHCIDCIAPGDAVLYCCDHPMEAARILHEYGATEVAEMAPPGRRAPFPAHGHASADGNRAALG